MISELKPTFTATATATATTTIAAAPTKQSHIFNLNSDSPKNYRAVESQPDQCEPVSHILASSSRTSLSSLIRPQLSAYGLPFSASNFCLSPEGDEKSPSASQSSHSLQSYHLPDSQSLRYSTNNHGNGSASNLCRDSTSPNEALVESSKHLSNLSEQPILTGRSSVRSHGSPYRFQTNNNSGRLHGMFVGDNLEDCISETNVSVNSVLWKSGVTEYTPPENPNMDMSSASVLKPLSEEDFFLSNDTHHLSPSPVQSVNTHSVDENNHYLTDEFPSQFGKMKNGDYSTYPLSRTLLASETSLPADNEEYVPSQRKPFSTTESSPYESSGQNCSEALPFSTPYQLYPPANSKFCHIDEPSVTSNPQSLDGMSVQSDTSKRYRRIKPDLSLDLQAINSLSQSSLGSASIENCSSSSSFSQIHLIDTAPATSGTGLLIPRMKTIEQYKRNARKSNDPKLEFELAQFMMQTALIANSSREISEQSKALLPFEYSDSDQSSQSYTRIEPLSRITSRSDSRDVIESPNESQKSGSTSSGVNISTSDPLNINEAKLISNLLKDAISSLKRLSERGYSDAQYLLGDIYSSSAITNKPDPERSIKYFLMAAKHGHTEASYRAALCLQEGWGTNRDASRAIQFFKKAAIGNQPGALYQLGMAYFYGGMGIADTNKNRQAGVNWLTRAVDVSDFTYNRAPHELAKIYEIGYKDLVLPDEGYAVKLYTHSATLKFVPSAARLGRAYEFGELGCPQDATLSIHYYTIAALGNDPNAQLAMCAWYMVGAGSEFPINHDEAFEWALRAALNKLPKAQYTVGCFYEKGTGCQANVQEAAKWYKRAATNGHEKSKLKLQNLGISDDEQRRNKCTIM